MAASPVPVARKREVARATTLEEPEELGDDEDVPEEDNNPYCYCHQPSHGEVSIWFCFCAGQSLNFTFLDGGLRRG